MTRLRTYALFAGFVVTQALRLGVAILVFHVVLEIADHLLRYGWSAVLINGRLPVLTLSIVVVAAASCVRGSVQGARQVLATMRVRWWIRRNQRPLSERLLRAGEEVGHRAGLTEVGLPQTLAFTVGFFRPRVVVSSGMVAVASDAELRAVLHHEACHAQHLDPLRMLLWHALPETVYALPAVHDLRERYEAGRELAADRRAIRACGRRAVAGVLYKVAQPPVVSERGVVTGLRDAALPVRISQLESGITPDLPKAPRRRLLASVAMSVLYAFLLWSAVLMHGHDALMHMVAGGHHIVP